MADKTLELQLKLTSDVSGVLIANSEMANIAAAANVLESEITIWLAQCTERSSKYKAIQCVNTDWNTDHRNWSKRCPSLVGPI